MILRFADAYEVRKMDKWNWGVYRVMPEGYETKSPIPTADDGRRLMHTGTYHGTAAAAIRKAGQLIEDDAISCPEASEMAARLESFERSVSDAAERIESALKRMEAAS